MDGKFTYKPSLHSLTRTSRHYSEFDPDNSNCTNNSEYAQDNCKTSDNDFIEEPESAPVSKHLTSSPYKAAKLEHKPLATVKKAIKSKGSGDKVTVNTSMNDEYFLYDDHKTLGKDTSRVTVHKTEDFTSVDIEGSGFDTQGLLDNTFMTVKDSKKAFELSCSKQSQKMGSHYPVSAN